MHAVDALLVCLSLTASAEGLSSFHTGSNFPASGALKSVSSDDSLGPSSEVGTIRPRRVCILSSDFPDVDQSLSEALSFPLWTPGDDEPLAYTHALSAVASSTGKYAVGLLPLETESPDDGVKRKKESARRRDRKSLTTQMKPLVVDWCSSQRASGDSGPDLLIKAVAPNRAQFADQGGARVYDLTAGLGQDAVLIACAQANVHMVERDPIVFALLQDALRRLEWEAQNGHALEDRKRASNLASRLSMENADGAQVASKLGGDGGSTEKFPDIVYLDPMFPPRRKRAAVKKNMQILHGLLDSQTISDVEKETQQEQRLLEAAMRIAKVRVVVKRPIHADSLSSSLVIKPTYQICGSTNRWDVYVKSSLS